MKKDAANIITLVMLILSCVITVAFLIFSVLCGIISKEVPPVLILLFAAVFWGWIDFYYYDCYRWMKDNRLRNRNSKTTLRRASMFLIIAMSAFSFSMLLVLFVSAFLYGVRFDFQIYFLIVAIVTAGYAVHNVFMLKTLWTRDLGLHY